MNIKKVGDELKGKRFLEFFEEICAVPHGSGDTERLRKFCIEFAEDRGLRYRADEGGNLIIYKDAAQGCEDAPVVMLQGHIDMVCEKEQGSSHDFKNDGLSLLIEDDEWLTADGTTLGADDGIAAAYMLSVLDDDDLVTPQLECVFTADEEVGMLGAEAIDLSDSEAVYMINLDTGTDGKLLAGCAGGVIVSTELSLSREHAGGDDTAYRLVIEGLTGGHSGEMIGLQRANASRLMVRLLGEIKSAGINIRLVSIDGGRKDNAIPSYCEAVILAYGEDGASGRLEEIVSRFRRIYKNEYDVTDPDLEVRIVPLTEDERAHAAGPFDESVFFRLALVLGSAPDGVVKMSNKFEGLVQTSLNAGITETVGDKIRVSWLLRSSVDSEKEELKERLINIIKAASGTVEVSGDYPGWEFRAESELRELVTDAWRDMTGEVPDVEAIHAGLECGIFSGKLPHLDIVSFGPEMEDIHTPRERLNIPSAVKYYDLLIEILERFCITKS